MNEIKKIIIIIIPFAIIISGCLFGDDDKKKELTPFQFDSIPGYIAIPEPENNPTTNEGVALGRMLFHDPILSADSSQSCASCHNQKFAFSDNGSQFSLGINGLPGGTNAPAIVNAAWNTFNFWDGRAKTLEDQALGPVTNPDEMASKSWTEVIRKLKSHPDYPGHFQNIFGTSDFDSTHVAKAISQFERTFISNNSKYDKVIRGEASFTEQEFRGNRIFFTEKGDCFHCHVVDVFDDGLFHNNGLDSIVGPKTGRGAVTNDQADDGTWKTPTLRNIEYSAPYMHDGRFATLEEVIEFYAHNVDSTSRNVDPLVLKRYDVGRTIMTTEEKADLLAFLKTLSDPDFINNPDFSSPF